MNAPNETASQTMNPKLSLYSIGVGDRFAHQASAQLAAVVLAHHTGVAITPVWNKSFREHEIIGSRVAEVRSAADAASRALDWRGAYFVDADHINLDNVDFFIDTSDFFTIDVAGAIGRPAAPEEVEAFVRKHGRFAGELTLPGLAGSFCVSREQIRRIAEKYLYAACEAGTIYRHICASKGEGRFVAEVSMDETDEPQTPVELFFILAALADQEVPLQTIAPRFSGRFNKGVDYVGDAERFRSEFEQDVALLELAIDAFGLPDNLKLSVHSGSDKFCIYPIMRQVMRARNAGVHLKTAGTTWLEELIGLAASGGEGLDVAKEIYCRAFDRCTELCAPYASVIDIDRSRLPLTAEVMGWDGEIFAAALRHDQSDRRYNPHLRQLLHVSYKVAAQMGDRFLQQLEANAAVIAENVTCNVFERHITPLFLD